MQFQRENEKLPHVEVYWFLTENISHHIYTKLNVTTQLLERCPRLRVVPPAAS